MLLPLAALAALRDKHSGQRWVQYVVKEVLANSAVSEAGVRFSEAADYGVLALYAERPVTGVLVDMAVAQHPRKLSLFLKAPSITLRHSTVVVRVDGEGVGDRTFAGLALSCGALGVYYSDVNVTNNVSARSSAMVQYVKGDAAVVATKVTSIFRALNASGLFQYFGGARLDLVNSSVLTVLDVGLEGDARGVCAGALAAVATSAAVVSINSSMISGYVNASAGLRDGDSVSTLLGRSAGGEVAFVLVDSQYCMQGNYERPTCGDEGGCAVRVLRENVPDPIKYVSFKSFERSDGELRYGFGDINGNNTDFELTEAVSGSAVTGTASLFYKQTRFFNIKVSAYDIRIGARAMSMMVLDNEETIYKCINIRLSGVSLGGSSTIYMLQQRVTTSVIQSVVVNCEFGTMSTGRYVGFSNVVPAGGSLDIVGCRINGTFRSHSSASTIGVNQVTGAGRVSVTDLYVSIGTIQHGGGSSVLMNTLEDVSNIVFDNASFSVNNTANSSHIGGGDSTFGGFCLSVSNSTYEIRNSRIVSTLHFQAAYTRTGIMVGRCSGSRVTLNNITVAGGLHFSGDVRNVGLVGEIRESELFSLTNVSVGARDSQFSLDVSGAARDRSTLVGAIGYILDANLVFQGAALNYSIDANETNYVGFIGRMECSPGDEGTPAEDAPQRTFHYPESFRGREQNSFTVKDIAISGHVTAFNQIGILVGELYKYQFNESNVLQNITVTSRAHGHYKGIDRFGTFAIIQYTYAVVRDVHITSVFTGYEYQNGGTMLSYIGGISGHAKAYVHLSFDNFTSMFDVAHARGTFGGLMGEISGWHSNQLYDGWRDVGTTPYSQINMTNSTMNCTIRNSGTQSGACVGVIQNASVRLRSVRLETHGIVRPMIGHIYQTPGNKYFKDPSGRINASLYEHRSYLGINNVTINTVQNCIGRKGGSVRAFIHGYGGVCTKAADEMDWDGSWSPPPS